MKDEAEAPISDAEVARRRDAALQRALNTPPQLKHGKGKESNPVNRGRYGKRQTSEAAS